MKTVAAAPRPESVECIEESERATVLLHPMRLEIVRMAREPLSASEIADRLGLPRQRVNYHVRELARARFLRRAGARRKRNLIERLYVASSGSYLLGPGVLGPAAPDAALREAAPEAAHMMALAARTQAEVARASRSATKRGLTLPVLSLNTEFHFESAAQRAAFTEALAAAVTRLVKEHTSPSRLPDGHPAPGRPHRLLVFCHPFSTKLDADPSGAGETREDI
jgi:DNA-binding CsgD family transcriptional regulator